MPGNAADLFARLQPGVTVLQDFGKGNPNTRRYHVRAVVDGDQLVVRTWNKSGHWAYSIWDRSHVEVYAQWEGGHIKVLPGEPKLRCLDKYGWPVETFKGRPVLNLLRRLIHTRRIARWAPPVFEPNPNVTCRVGHATEGGSDAE